MSELGEVALPPVRHSTSSQEFLRPLLELSFHSKLTYFCVMALCKYASAGEDFQIADLLGVADLSLTLTSSVRGWQPQGQQLPQLPSCG